MEQSAAAPAGTTLTDTLVNQAVTGGNGITPQFGGEIDSGPVFEIAIFDTQNFEQGILGGVTFSTVENYIDQGFDNQLLLRLLVDRIEIRVKEDQTDAAGKIRVAAGTLVQTLVNEPSGPKAKEFAGQMACYELQAVVSPRSDKVLAPLSRITRPAAGGSDALKFDDLAKLDGKTLDLKGVVTANPADDANVQIVRPSDRKRAPHLEPVTCAAIYSLADPLTGVIALPPKLPDTPPEDIKYVGHGKVFLLDYVKGDRGHEVDADMQITFRSPEGVIRFLGRYLKATVTKPDATWTLPGASDDGTKPLFSVTKADVRDPVVSTELLGERYSIPKGPHLSENMLVLALVEQLINLQKSNADKPSTLPVQLLP
jgi:hypothetical protein